MSAAGTLRAGSRNIKEKATKEPQQTQTTKTDGQNTIKHQPTQEQIRLAQMISHPNDPELSRKIEQIKELTKRKEDDVIIALHDAGYDTEKAVNLLLEGDDGQGEWKETVKKRKKPTPAAPTKSESLTNHVNEKGDKREESKEREQNHTDRSDGPPRRSRRPGIPIPRLSRGRGRDRSDFNKGDRDRPTENGDWDQENDNTFRERGFERGRGRGRGGRGRGRGGGRNFRGGQRFEKDSQPGPQIDTWTNETAANAEKNQSEFGGSWGDMATEDWNEDWTGSLEETKIFTATSIQQPSPNVDLTPPLNDSTNTFEQRFDLQAFAKSVVAAEASQAEAQFISQFNQQATESIKNSIGIGSSRPPGSTFQPVAPPSSSMGPLAALTQNSQPPPDNQRMQQASLSPTQSLSSQSPITTQSVLQQRPKAQRSKLPPPSKIPASAVEMPGHIMPSQEIQFSLEFGFGNDSSPFAFGDSSASSTKTYNTASTNVNSSNLTNHLNQVSKAAESVISSSMMASPSGNNTGLSNIDQTSPRTNMFQAAPYTSPAKKDTTSLGQSNQLASPETSSFLSSQSDIKTSPLMGAQRPTHGQSVKALSQGALSSKADNSALSSYVQNSTNYQSSSFQSHKPSALSSSAGYATTTTTQSNSFSSQFQSPTNQYQAALNQSGSNQFQQSQLQSATNQFQQNQLQAGSSQFQTNPNQFQAFQSAGSSFQSNYAGNQSNSSSLYQNSNPSSVYQPSTGSYHTRDAQSGTSFQNSAGQTASYQRESQTKSSYSRDSQTSAPYQRESQSGSQPYPRDSQSASLTYSSRDAQGASSAYQRDNSAANSFQRESQTGGSSAYQRDAQTGSSAFQRDSQSGSSSFHCDTQPSSATFQKDTPTANSYSRDSQSSSAAFQRESQTANSSYPRDNQSATSYQRDSQSASSFTRDSQSASFPRESQTSSSFQRDGQTYQRDTQSASSFPRENQTSSAFQSQTSSFPRDSTQTSSFPRDSSQTSSSYPRDSIQTSSSYVRESSQTNSSYPRDTQSSSAFQRDSQSSSAFQRDASSTAFQRDSQSASSFPLDGQSSISTAASQSQSSFTSQTFGASGHQSGLQTSPLTNSKLTETLSKMSVKEPSLETSTTQHESTSSTVSTVSLTTSVSSISSLTTCNSSVSSTVTTTNVISSKMSTMPANTKAPPNLPPGVPLVGQYIVGQGTVPHFYGLQGVQQPLYTSYEDLQMLQQRLPMAANSYYDMGGYAVPTTLAGRDQVSIGNVPFTGTVTDNKLTRVEAQSPIPSTQQQTSQSTHQQQPYINLHYGYYAYPSVLPGAGSFQYPMFPMPPVSNTAAAHAGSTGTPQYQKTYTSHGYGTNKAYDDLTQSTDFTKSAYGASQNKGLASQSAVGVGAGTLSSNDMSAYAKSHTQAFDKQAFHGGTPPPFNMSLATASQAGPMGAPTTPYGTPYLHMMPQPHSMMHHPLQQDSSGASRSSQQSSTQQKTTATKNYGNYWSGN